jgi:hypothetical protein
MDNNEKQVTKIETTATRCAAAPKTGAKNSDQCPYAAADGSDICKLHQSLEKRYSVRFRRVGEPVPEVKAAPEPSTIHADVQVPPEAVTPKAKKQSKKAKVQAALAVLQAKQAEKADGAAPAV